ncbi:hypothetical protein GXP67_13885 [Rhodocytophaga rosea]|uniref:Uncharacterized protein n=1 Tax=Rhodocytophaga rosea TaxID=2704465 RepID=A0A6C0GIV3_9BACT|nr:hypothetical protein [Rhodocytophaga rosea]QHT67640.1 hypothetical protein GXP67_13885 [Rhodocytophaga rosea]
MFYSIFTTFRNWIFVALLTSSLLIYFTIPSLAQSDSLLEKSNSVHFGLGYPVSNHGTQAAKYSNIFSFNATVGLSRQEKGFSLSGFSNIVKDSASGFQLAGFSNHIGQYMQGLGISGFMNTYGRGKGWQIAGFTNLARNQVQGMQVAGFLNKAGDTHGFQTAGFINKAGNVTGGQVAGFTNIAKQVKGVQIAGFMNKAASVKGVQIAGFINIADSSDYPIGPINIIKNGEMSIGVSIDETQTALLSFRSGGKVLYGIVGAGYNFKNEKAKYALEGGMGAHWLRSNTFRLNTELVMIHLSDFKDVGYTKIPLRVLPSWKPSRHLEIYAGPTFNFIMTDTTEGKELVKHTIWDDKGGRNMEALTIGFMGGIHVIL